MSKAQEKWEALQAAQQRFGVGSPEANKAQTAYRRAITASRKRSRHYGFDSIKEMASDIGNGWKECVLELDKGDTAYAPGTTKYNILATDKVTVTYRIHPSGVQAFPSDDAKVSRTSISAKEA